MTISDFDPEAIEPWRKPTIGEQAADAIEKAAGAKVEAFRLRKLAERIRDRCQLDQKGTVDERRAKANLEPAYLAADDSAIEAESNAIIAKAKADAWAIKFSEWQSANATAREEMKMR